jgi:hypothetical protein
MRMNTEIVLLKYHRNGNKLLPDTERVMRGLSGMKGNFLVPFLDEERRVTASSLVGDKISTKRSRMRRMARITRIYLPQNPVISLNNSIVPLSDHTDRNQIGIGEVSD